MLLQLNDITKTFSNDTVLSGVSLKIEEGERVAIVGVNGAGKSTLLKIIAKDLDFDSGEIHIKKGTKMGYLRQNSGLRVEETIWSEMKSVFEPLLEVERQLRELEEQMGDVALMEDPEKYEQVMARYAEKSELFLQEGGYEIDTKIRGILQGMGFEDMSTNTVIKDLSGGQKTRLALAKILLQEPNLLMLDEPTNHLDFKTLAWLETYLKSYTGTIVVVSHDRYFLDSLVTIVYEVERTTATRYVGNYSSYVEQKETNRELQAKKYEMQQEQIKQMEDYVVRNIASASSSKSAKNKRKQIERMELIDEPLKDLKRSRMVFSAKKPSHRHVLTVKDVDLLVMKDEVKVPIVENINFQLERGERIGLIGDNGVGKSTLLKTLVNRRALENGAITWGEGVTIGYYDQEQLTLHAEKTIFNEVWDDFPEVEEAKIRAVLGSFLFLEDDIHKEVSALSGGEKARVALAKLMLLEANMMVIDEPTNHLDLYSKDILETAFDAFDGTLLFISHDRYFVNKLANKIYDLTPSGVKIYYGNYDDYVDKKAENKSMTVQ